MTDEEKREHIARFYRQDRKPKIKINHPRFCPHCGEALGPQTYFYSFKNTSGHARSFRSICIGANIARKQWERENEAILFSLK